MLDHIRSYTLVIMYHHCPLCLDKPQVKGGTKSRLKGLKNWTSCRLAKVLPLVHPGDFSAENHGQLVVVIAHLEETRTRFNTS